MKFLIYLLLIFLLKAFSAWPWYTYLIVNIYFIKYIIIYLLSLDLNFIQIYIVTFYNILNLLPKYLILVIINNNSIFMKIFLIFYIKIYFFFFYSSLIFFFCIFLSLFSFLILLFFGSFLGLYGSLFIIFFNFFFSLSIVISNYFFFLKNIGFLYLNTDLIIFKFLNFNLSWSFFCDSITINMFLIVLLISFLVHIYSIFYMRMDPQLIRFLSLLSLFTFSMLFLVSSSNLLQLFFGWEGVGICSYLLVNFWFTRMQANKAAIKAMLMNRFGDISLLIFISLFYYIFHTFDFFIVIPLIFTYKYAYIDFFFFSIHLYSLLSFFLIIAAVGKSAQLGLHTWLPDAMEGPTPVSALIHAATMVTAGVFILIRFSFIIDLSLLKFLIFLFGCLTALFGSIVASFQNDIKKIIAYSTCSQLGYMVVACTLGHYNLALFHLFNHAFFKALLFLSAGVILHSLLDEQDIRKMGGLLNFLPFTYCCLFIASYSLMGLPFLSGFYSKDLILEISFFTFEISSFFSFCLLLLSAFFTAFYSIRLIILVFFQIPKGTFISYFFITEGNLFMLIIFFILSLFSLFSGYYFSEIFIGIGSNFFYFNNLVNTYNSTIDYEFIFFFYKLIPFFFSLFGLILGYILFIYLNTLIIYKNIYFQKIFTFFINKWYFDLIYNKFIINNSLFFSYNITYKLLDKNLFELLGVNIFYYSFTKISFFYKNIFSSYIYSYLLFIFFGVIFLLTIFLFNFNVILIFFFNFLYFYTFFFFLKKKNKNKNIIII